MGKKVDLTGQRFGKLVVLGECEERSKGGRIMLDCICDCGNTVTQRADNLKIKKNASCGCVNIKGRDLTNRIFGNLIVLNDLKERDVKGNVTWNCLCICGKQITVTSSGLTSGNNKSCGCITTKIDLKGKRFGKWSVLGDSGNRDKDCNVLWDCICDCGEERRVSSRNLRRGMSKSCGCSNYENMKGQRFGSWTVVPENCVRDIRGVAQLTCLCDCGKYKVLDGYTLLTGKSKSCGCERPKGKDHHSYNPNLTDEERLKNRYQLSGGNSSVWSKQVMERDNYTCQVCGDNKGGNLNAHHLNAWNAFPEQRFDLDNGVTLCTDCHKEFHSQYGYGDNTREQFDEYAASKTLVLN